MKLKHYNSYLKEYNELIFYCIIGILSFLWDIYTGKDKLYNNCKEPVYTLLLLFLHHLYTSFLNFGWLSNDKNILILHILLIFITIIIQIINNLKCPLTHIVNTNCNIKRGSYLRDFLYFIKIKDNNLYLPYRICSFIISLVKLYNLKN
jgi:hypothetical protein